MSLASLFSLPLQDPASAGSFVSGPPQQQAAPQQPVRGLVPPDAEANPPTVKATGLTEAFSDVGRQPIWNTSPSDSRHDSGSLSYTQGVVQALGGDPYHFQFSDGLGARGLVQPRWMRVGGLQEPMNEPRTLELSSNDRLASAFEFLANAGPQMDWTGTLATIRDINDLGAYLDRRGAENAADQLKQSIARMGFQPPTPEQLGAMQEYTPNEFGEMAPAYNPHDLVDRYRKALQMAALERQGTIELDHDNWKIKSIGAAKLTPEQFVNGIRSRYEEAFSDALDEADQILASGGRLFASDVPLELQRGIWADTQARSRLRQYAQSIGVPEGPGQLLALNRWAYFQDNRGLYAQPDVLINMGLEDPYIYDGKAIQSKKLSSDMNRQLSGYHRLGAGQVTAVTPWGLILVPRKRDGRGR